MEEEDDVPEDNSNSNNNTFLSNSEKRDAREVKEKIIEAMGLLVVGEGTGVGRYKVCNCSSA
jgi:hypothetical protein